MLENNENLQKIFEHPPLVAYKKPRTLGNILSKTFLCNHDKNAALGFHHCTKSNCSTCSHSSISTFFQSFCTKKEFHILKSIDCDFSNLIYLINCNKCGKQYVGETGRKLKYRFTEHLRDIKKNLDTTVAIHFNMADHSVEDISILGINLLFKSGNYRKHKEQFWINKLNTTQLVGLNIKDWC